ncbi:MAG: hypothetical protein L3K03_03395 [Thermoplasmata archaeon]|nr:hypothetical protein [Thermoplasmata archaeon]
MRTVEFSSKGVPDAAVERPPSPRVVFEGAKLPATDPAQLTVPFSSVVVEEDQVRPPVEETANSNGPEVRDVVAQGVDVFALAVGRGPFPAELTAGVEGATVNPAEQSGPVVRGQLGANFVTRVVLSVEEELEGTVEGLSFTSGWGGTAASPTPGVRAVAWAPETPSGADPTAEGVLAYQAAPKPETRSRKAIRSTDKYRAGAPTPGLVGEGEGGTSSSEGVPGGISVPSWGASAAFVNHLLRRVLDA